MYNKYTRDLQVKQVVENQRRKMVTGYMDDDIFQPPPAIARAMATINTTSTKKQHKAESRLSGRSGRLSQAERTGNFSQKSERDPNGIRSVTLDPDLVKLAN